MHVVLDSCVSGQSSVVSREWSVVEFDTGHRRRAAATWSRDCASPYPATDDWPLTTDASPLTPHHSPLTTHHQAFWPRALAPAEAPAMRPNTAPLVRPVPPG